MPYRRYGSRVGNYRARRRSIGKRKSFRRVSPRKVVTRRMLQRVVRPLRPEIKCIDYANTYEMNTDSAPTAPDATVINTTQPAQPGPIGITCTNLSMPIPLTQIMRANVSNCRIGAKVRIKSIRINMCLHAANATSATEPYRFSVYIIRSKALGQYYPGYIASVMSGTMYPHAMHLAGADSPAWWYHQGQDIDSFSDPDNVIGPRKAAAQLVWRRTYTMNANVDDNPAAGQPFSMPLGGKSIYNLKIDVPISKVETHFNDNDASLSSGYFAANHYWLTVIQEPDPGSANCIVAPGDLVWRVLYTDS